MELWIIVGLFGASVFLIGLIPLVYIVSRPPNVEKLKANGNVPGLIRALKFNRTYEAGAIRGNAALALGQLRSRQAVVPLLKALQDKNPHVRQAAAVALGRLYEARAVVPLALVLHRPGERQTAVRSLRQLGNLVINPLDTASKHPSSEMRQAAVTAMGEIGDLWAVQSLLFALQHHDPATRAAAAQSLVKLGRPAAVAVTSLIQNVDPEVRLIAVETLKKIGDPNQADALRTALQDKDSRVRRTAAQALDSINRLPITEQEQVNYWIATQQWQNCVALGEPAVEPLISVLKSEDDGAMGATQQAAAEALQEIGAPAVKSLIPLLNSEDITLRQIAAIVLGKIGHPQAIPPLLEALQNAELPARPVLVASLDKLNWQPDNSDAGAIYWVTKQNWDNCVAVGEAAVEPLVKIIKDKDTQPAVYENVVGALEKIKSPKAADLLANHWVAENNWEKAIKLGASAIKPLETALNAPEQRLQAIDALGQIGDAQAVEPILASLIDTRWLVRDRVVKALAQIDAPAVDQLVVVAKNANGNRDEVERQVAIEALGQIGDTKSAIQLLNIFRKSNNDYKIRKAAARSLGQIRYKKATDFLIAAVNNSDERWDIRQASIISLGEIGDERALRPLIVVLSDWREYGSLRETAAEALGEIGHTRAVEPLIQALDNKGLSVRQAAARALAQISGEDFGTDESQWYRWWNGQKRRIYSNFSRYKLKNR